MPAPPPTPTQMRIPFTFQDHSAADRYGFRFMTHEGALASNWVGISVWCLIAYLLHRANIIFRL